MVMTIPSFSLLCAVSATARARGRLRLEGIMYARFAPMESVRLVQIWAPRARSNET